MVRVTCLSQQKTTLALLVLLIFRTFDQQLDLLLEANIEHNMQSRQIITTKNNTPSRKSLKRGQGLALGPRTQKHSELSKDLDYITQGYVLGKF
jgi:hypothetical protein